MAECQVLCDGQRCNQEQITSFCNTYAHTRQDSFNCDRL
jgi:hypothetical protein